GTGGGSSAGGGSPSDAGDSADSGTGGAGGHADAGVEGGVLGASPTFTVDVQTAPTRFGPDANFVDLDPLDSQRVFWRRDEVATLRLWTNDEVSGGVVQGLIFGVADGGTAGIPLPATQCSASLPCVDAGFCECLSADLSKPIFGALRGSMSLAVVWTRTDGGTSTQTTASDPAHIPSIPVTRFRWRLVIGPPMGFDFWFEGQQTPAIDSDGNVVVTTGLGALSVAPTGGVRFVISGAAQAAVIGSRGSAGIQRVTVGRSAYTAANPGDPAETTSFIAFNAHDGSPLSVACRLGREYDPLALLSDSNETVVTFGDYAFAAGVITPLIGDDGSTCSQGGAVDEDARPFFAVDGSLLYAFPN